MSGEFEKRIRDVVPDYFKETDNDNGITRAIGEAKKEFESFRICSTCIEEEHHNMQKWFKKWFGKKW